MSFLLILIYFVALHIFKKKLWSDAQRVVQFPWLRSYIISKYPMEQVYSHFPFQFWLYTGIFIQLLYHVLHLLALFVPLRIHFTLFPIGLLHWYFTILDTMTTDILLDCVNIANKVFLKHRIHGNYHRPNKKETKQKKRRAWEKEKTKALWRMIWKQNKDKNMWYT